MTAITAKSSTYRVKFLVLSSGERFSGIVDAGGMLTFAPNLYAMLKLRQRVVAASTMNAHMRAIALALNWAEKLHIDLDARTSSLQMLGPDEISGLHEALRVHHGAVVEGSKDDANKRPLVVSAGAFRNRVHFVAEYLLWLGKRAIHTIRPDDPKHLEARMRLEWFEGQMLANLPHVTSTPREGLDEEGQRLFLEVIRPDDPRNPFKKEHRHRNHALLLLIYETGSRRGELLKVKSDKLFLNGESPTVHFARSPDDPRDPRKDEPNTKTQEHIDPISADLAGALRTWVNVHRSDAGRYPGAKRTAYVFVARTGRPIAARTVNDMFELLANKFPTLGNHVFPHILRNTAHDRFSVAAEESGLSEELEQQARNYKFGYRKGSRQGDHYRRRHIRRAAAKVMLRMQENSVQGQNR